MDGSNCDMKNILTAIVLALFIAVAWRYLPMGAHIATGYSAKQLCSGVFVAGLPEAFIRERDIEPRMAVLGPLLSHLKLESDPYEKTVEAHFLGFSSIAEYRPATGCTLNPIAGPETAERAVSPQLSRASLQQGVVPPPPGLAPAYREAFREPEGGGRNTLGLIVMHRGKIIAEQYRFPVNLDTPMQGWSMNKSLIATWVGLQVKRGQLSLDMPVLKALQSTGEPLLGLEQKIDPGLSLFNLLHMESGFNFVETYDPGDDATQMLYNSPAMWRIAPGRGHAYPPAQHFSYSSGDTNLAAFLWQASLQGQHYSEWLDTNFTQALNLTRVTAEPDASGIQVGSSYTYMTARDWAQVGQFWLDAWHERTELLPLGWQRQATEPSASNHEGNYGLAFWLNTQGSQMPSLPKNLFYAGGNSGQRVVVFPDQELVIVRLGLSQSGVDQGVERFSRQVLDIIGG